MTKVILRAGAVVAVLLPVWLAAQGQGQGQVQGQAEGRGQGQGRGGGRISMPQQEEIGPAQPLRNLFTQDAYTEYQILEPGSESFRIKFLPEQNRAGATELLNATRGGSEGSGVEVYDPRTGKPLKFVYEPSPSNPADHQIRATLPMPVPEGGVGRVLIYKTYKDERTYRMDGEDIAWVRSLSGYRLGVVLPKGFAFISSNVAAQLSTTADGRLKLAFANPSGQSNPVTVRAHKTTAVFTQSKFDDMFFDDIKTLYDLDATGSVRVEQTYSDYRKGDTATLDSITVLGRRIGSRAKTSSAPAQARFAVTDGATTVGSIDVIGGLYVAIDTAGVIVGRYKQLREAMRAFPQRRRA